MSRYHMEKQLDTIDITQAYAEDMDWLENLKVGRKTAYHHGAIAGAMIARQLIQDHLKIHQEEWLVPCILGSINLDPPAEGLTFLP